MSEQKEFDHVAFMKDPFEWPNLVLPVKRFRGTIEVGLLIGDGPIVYLANMWDKGVNLKQVATAKYATFEELHEDGWRVD